ncbi:MAG: hypothetical protein KC492_16630 [Myxococcales bacterium]|nr:hypothetical protein [Myxococcales bacterium]
MKLPNVNDASLYIGTRVLDQTDGGVLAVARVILEGDEHGPAIRATLVRGAEEPVDTFRQRITDMLRELKSYRTFDHRSVVYLASSNLHTAAEHMAADARWNARNLTWHLIDNESNPMRQVRRLIKFADAIGA